MRQIICNFDVCNGFLVRRVLLLAGGPRDGLLQVQLSGYNSIYRASQLPIYKVTYNGLYITPFNYNYCSRGPITFCVSNAKG